MPTKSCRRSRITPPYGGVVPEIAARAHLLHLQGMIRATMNEAGAQWSDLAAIAATCGPGLIGGLIVGATMGKAIAAARRLPFIAINHLEAHALTARLTDNIAFPYLLLLVSGGHTQILLAEEVGHYRQLGTTLDDAAGEAFDKVAKLLGLGFPGGPALERAAAAGDLSRFPFTQPLAGRPGCDFSFSGLKTAARLLIEKLAPLSEQDKSDIAAAFEACVAKFIAARIGRAIGMAQTTHTITALVIAGGVAANTVLRAALNREAESAGLRMIAPSPALCTDNAAMVAWAGIERLQRGLIDDLAFAPRPRWPLDESRAA